MQWALRTDLGISDFGTEKVFSKAISIAWKIMPLLYKYNDKAYLKWFLFSVFVGN